MSVTLTEAFRKYGAVLKNVNWSVSAENESGELILSLWKHYFNKPSNGVIQYEDSVSRWSGHGNKEFIERLDKAFKTKQTIRPVLVRTDDEDAVSKGKDASKLKNTFYVKESWYGEIVKWDGNDFIIKFKEIKA